MSKEFQNSNKTKIFEDEAVRSVNKGKIESLTLACL